MERFAKTPETHVLEVATDDIGRALRILTTGSVPRPFMYTPPRLLVVNQREHNLLTEKGIHFDRLEGEKASDALENHHRERKIVSKEWMKKVFANLYPGVSKK